MKKLLAFILCAAMLFGCTACGNTHNKRNEGMLPFEGSNLFKLTTAEDFAEGVMEGVEPAAVGNGAVQLSDGVLEGTFTSAEFYCDNFTRMVASWNASIADGASVEIFGRARMESQDTEEVIWSDWLTWGEFSPYMKRGSTQNKQGAGGYVDQDTFCAVSGCFDGFQMKAVIRRDSAEIASPVLRELTMTFAGGDMVPGYAEKAVELPAQALCPSPAYSQNIRWDVVSDSICSPTTISVMLNTINPNLDLLPEEVALSSKDLAEGIFGSWSFCTSFAGCYGYECYAQYGGKDIILQELAKGHPVGLSVAYNTRNLTGAWGSTGGHLITLIGYEYEDGIMDDDHLYIFSSDSFSRDDCESYRRYKWTELANLEDSSFVCYVLASAEREEECTGVQRISASIEKGAETDQWILVDEEGNQISLDGFRNRRGFLCYTIEGVATDMTRDTYESKCSVVYPNAVNVSANNTFTYLSANNDSTFTLNKKDALKAAGVKKGTITVYAIGDSGYMYIGELK